MPSYSKKSRNRLRAKLHEKQGGVCVYCRIPLRVDMHGPRETGKQPTFEHLQERSKGGKFTNDNIVLACRRCNQERGYTGMNWLEYATHRAKRMGFE